MLKKVVLTLKDYRNKKMISYDFEVLQIRNSTEWHVGERLSEQDVNLIVMRCENYIVDVVIK